jgi:hypothetical protein
MLCCTRCILGWAYVFVISNTATHVSKKFGLKRNDFMEERLPCGPNNSADQDVSGILREPGRSLMCSQEPVHIIPSFFFKARLCLDLASDLFPSIFPTRSLS